MDDKPLQPPPTGLSQQPESGSCAESPDSEKGDRLSAENVNFSADPLSSINDTTRTPTSLATSKADVKESSCPNTQHSETPTFTASTEGQQTPPIDLTDASKASHVEQPVTERDDVADNSLSESSSTTSPITDSGLSQTSSNGNKSSTPSTPLDAEQGSAKGVGEEDESPTKPCSETVTSTPDTGIALSDTESPNAGAMELSGSLAGSTACAGGVSGSAEGTTPSGSGVSVSSESVYYIKWITFDQNKVPIITQNENGPCPLLAIMNVLLLKGKVKLAPMLEMVTSEQLMTYLGECLLENAPQNLSESSQANYEQNMQDAMGVMHKLQTGLDVNVKFTGVGDFEYTQECIIFDLLHISLYHGWLVDPQDLGTTQAVQQYSYNQLVERIIGLKNSQKELDVTQALLAEQFLDRSASQLTYHGLCELQAVVKDLELCVFFRNNHFNTLYKYNNELFLLVTDQGFLTEANVVWETLSNVDGDCHFVDTAFRTYTKPAASTEPIPECAVPVGSLQQIDQDHELACRLQDEENRRASEAAQSAAQHRASPPAQLSGSGQPHGPAAPSQASRGGPPSHQQGAEGRGGGAPRRDRSDVGGGRSERREKEGRDCTIL